MKHLVVTTSSDLSFDLLKSFADTIVLDKEPVPSSLVSYDTVYIRSHFSKPSTLPQNFSTQISNLAADAKSVNANIKFIDNMDEVATILAFEDKWSQYEVYGNFMPKTQLLSSQEKVNFKRPVFKNRLSSRGSGVTWDLQEVTGSIENWIVQESLDIKEELRVYVIHGNVYPQGVVRQSKTSQQKIKALNARDLTQDEIAFSMKVSECYPSLDFIGLDITRTSDGQLSLIEVNRSPDFLAFAKLTGFNLASVLY